MAKGRANFLYASLVVFLSFPLWAENNVEHQFDANQQRRQLEQQEAVYQQQIQANDVHLHQQIEALPSLPKQEKPCFPIQQIELIDLANPTHSSSPLLQQFHWLLPDSYQKLKLSLPFCFGQQSLNLLLKTMQNELIARGFISSRVLLTEQNLQSGKLQIANCKLQISLLAGRIAQLKLEDQSQISIANPLTLWTAMPISQGKLLNLRDLEQGLENLKRNPSAEADFQLLAGKEIGTSDLLIKYKQRFPWHLTLGLDDAGSKATGRLQGSLTFSWDNPLTLNDLFYLSWTKSIKRHSDNALGDYGSNNLNWHYSLPWRYWLLTLSGSNLNYYQTIAGANQNYRYSGKSQQLQLNLSHVLQRNQHSKTQISLGLWGRKSFNYINDTEIQIQRRRMAGWEIKLNHLQYIGKASLQAELAYKRGTGAYHALPAPEEKRNSGTSRPRIWHLKLALNYPFSIGKQPWRFISSWQAQWNKSHLIQQDRFSIGGRYSVRGFDGELSLSGERGWLWRNELAWNVLGKGHEFYWALDKGEVRNGNLEQLGERLVGTSMGLRGKLWGLNYDYFVGRPLDKPQGFRTSPWITGFTVSYRF